MNNFILKKIMPQKSIAGTVEYEDLPASIQKLKDTVAVVKDAIEDPDKTWDMTARVVTRRREGCN